MRKMNPLRIYIPLVLCLFLWSCSAREMVSFAFVTDTHVGKKNAEEDLVATVKDINSLKDIDFVVTTGDITNFGFDKDFSRANEILSQLNKKWYIFPGNHDTKWSETGGTSFRKIFGTDRFAFKYKGYHFIGCGSGPEVLAGPGMVTSDDVRWLNSVILSIHDDNPVIYFNHYPLNNLLCNSNKIIEILKRKNLQAVLCGHLHKNELLNFQGIPGVVGNCNINETKNHVGYNIVTLRNDSLLVTWKSSFTRDTIVWAKLKLTDLKETIIPQNQQILNENEKSFGVTELWSLQDSSDIVSGMVRSGNLCYYTNTNGEIKAVNIESGKMVWRYKTQGKIFSTPAIENEKIVVSSTDGNIYCLDAETGDFQWRYTTNKAILASPSIRNNVVYIGSSEDVFRAISLKNGRLIWENKEMRGHVETKPLLDETNVYFGDWGGCFYALNQQTGDMEWKWANGSSDFLSPAVCIPVSANGKVFISEPKGFVTAFNSRNGQVIWHSKQANGSESIGISGDKSVLFVKSAKDSLIAISTVTNEFNRLWSVNCGYKADINPAAVTEKDNTVYVSAANGTIYAVDAIAHKIIRKHKLSDVPLNAVLPLENNQVIASTHDGKIYKLLFKN